LEKDTEAVVIKKIGERARVLTSNFIHVDVPFCPKEIKQRVEVKITHVSEDRTEGIVLENLSRSLDEGVL
jgi:hypothetical protein